jgi:hypothetical protein
MATVKKSLRSLVTLLAGPIPRYRKTGNREALASLLWAEVLLLESLRGIPTKVLLESAEDPEDDGIRAIVEFLSHPEDFEAWKARRTLQVEVLVRGGSIRSDVVNKVVEAYRIRLNADEMLKKTINLDHTQPGFEERYAEARNLHRAEVSKFEACVGAETPTTEEMEEILREVTPWNEDPLWAAVCWTLDLREEKNRIQA